MTPIVELLEEKNKKVSSSNHVQYVLEIIQGRDAEILDTHYAASGKNVHIGSNVGNRLRFAGVPIAWVPQHFSALSWIMYPFTQIQEEWKSDFFSSYTHSLIQWKNGRACVHIHTDWSIQKIENGVLTKNMNHREEHLIEIGEHWMVTTRREWYAIRFVVFENRIPFSGFPEIDKGSYGIAAGFILSCIVTGLGVMNYQPPAKPKETEFPIHLLEASLTIPQAPQPEEQILKEKTPSIIAKSTHPSSSGSKIGKSNSNTSSSPINPHAHVNSFMKGLDFGGASLESNNDTPIIGFISNIGSATPGGGSFGMGLGDPWGSGGGTIEELGGIRPVGDGEGLGPRRSGPGKKLERVREPIIKTQNNYTVLGGLDKSLIDEQIKRNLAQIRYCYQRELPKNPTLGGKVRVQFIIGKDGSVSKANIKSSTINSTAVENCIIHRFLRFKFPKPEGEGIVMVNYPFMFQSSE